MIGARLAAAFATVLALGAVAAACGGGDCEGDECAQTTSTSTGMTTGTGGSGGGGLCASNADCSDGASCCAGSCVDLQNDSEHCGMCDIACGSPLGGSVACVAGACQLECFPGFADCNLLIDDGCEVDTTADSTHCGNCATVCLYANAEAGCSESKCTLGACSAGFADCNKSIDDGCEANLGDDANNCGVCGLPCFPAPNSVAACEAGQCKLGMCALGFDNCNANAVDGCEINLYGDPTNCGACGKVCDALPNSAPGCKDGFCAVGACDAGFADCDKSIWSGCETVLATDVNNCSACGVVCPKIAHGTPKCAAGACGIGACDAGYADCDGDASNGCEVNLASDAANCAACGNACPAVPNGMPVCAGFQCGIGACGADFADCFGGSADGCETNLKSAVDHCGACGTSCPLVANGSRACENGMCGIGMCAPSYGDCNMQLADGCEVDLKTDVNNCGGCGNVCPTPTNGVAGCVNGQCTLASCNQGYSNCNNSAGDGCELNTTVDAGNCGGCGLTCGSGTCQASTCSCFKTVLIIRDDSASGADPLKNALTAAGYSVTISPVPSYQYNGTNPALAGFGTVVVLAGGPNATSYSTDMPAAGQTAIANFVNAGNGLVLTEWASLHVASGRWQTLAPFVLLTRTQSYSGQVTYAIDPPFAAHPIWAGLPTTFTFASTSNVGLTKVASGVTRIAGSAQAIDAVAIRDAAKGRVAHIAHAGNYAPNGWSNVNVQKLVTNSVGWVARCQ